MKYYLSLIILALIFGNSCRNREIFMVKPFYDINGNHIGDSVYLGKIINKITFNSPTNEVDSVVFKYYTNKNHSLKSQYTFKNGKYIFENIDYYENGKIQKYIFIDEDNPNYYYERLYHNEGALLKVNGKIFFQGFIIDSANSEASIKKGTSLIYKIYYPNPPDCKVKLTIKNDDGSIYDVFSNYRYLNFVKTTYQENNAIGVFKVNVCIDLFDNSLDTTFVYCKELIFEVTP